MKKVFTLLTIVAMGITMIGCGEETKKAEKTKTEKTTTTETTPAPKTP